MIVPVVIWMVAVFVLIGATALLWLTVVLIPLVILFWVVLGIAAVVLPIVGAVRAMDGLYYRYPLVGLGPL